MLVEGARLPPLCAKPVFGRLVDVARMPGPLALLFLRHAGSPLTRRDLTALDRAWDDLDRAGATLIAVVEGSARDAFDVVPRQRVRFPVLHDGDGQFYAAFGVGRDRGLARTLADPRSAARWLSALFAEGRGGVGGPVTRVPAAFVAEDGVVTWAWRGATACDPLPIDGIARATARR